MQNNLVIHLSVLSNSWLAISSSLRLAFANIYIT